MRYIIGIDLGTTNSCVAYVDTEETRATVQSFKIPQLIREGNVEALPTLPSFCYLADSHEWPKGSLNLPWNSQATYFVGKFAQTQGAKVPTRLVNSAKSWLCHPAANRRDKILPLNAADEAARLSPVEATARYLRHIREAWNELMAKGDGEADFDAQEIILTVPASFDEIARLLTIEAARLAGFVHMTLLEEPQAAFYSWIAQHEGRWEQQLVAGKSILVCDVGGGTTDFSLIEVVEKGEGLTFQRMAVGNHLLLGGDNMDAAMAHLIESKLTAQGHEPNAFQRLQIVHEARQAKEALLQPAKGSAQESYRVLLQGSGSSVIQGTLMAEVTQSEVQKLLLDGFFGQYAWTEALKLNKAKGLRSMGLPYEDEPAITKHLARFLTDSGALQEGPKKPDYLLFNGGAMKPPLFQGAILQSLKSWFPEKEVSLLSSYSLDLAVARGAAYYGKARRGLGTKISGGIARGFYLVLDTQDKEGQVVPKALTLLPRGSEEGTTYEPGTTFMLTPNAPVSFQICTSHVRLHDRAGDLVPIDPQEMQMLPPIHTILRFGKRQTTDAIQEKLPVHLQITLTPIGTLEIALKSLKTEHRWQLEFQIRRASGQEDSLAALEKRQADQTFHVDYLKKAEAVVQKVFGTEKGSLKPEKLMETLEEVLETPRRDWSPSIMRSLADALLKLSASRKASPEYAGRWWNATGFLMRPGFGYALDDYRLKELWKVILNDYRNSLPLEVQIQMWICCRRVAGGMNKGQQMQLCSEWLPSIINKSSGLIDIKNRSEIYPYSEKIRAMAALELLEMPIKIKLGKALVARFLGNNALPSEYWALGRLGARHLLYGSWINVVPKDICQLWVEQLLNVKIENLETLALLLGQLARKTAHPELNLSQVYVDKILDRFTGTPQLAHLEEILLKETDLSSLEQEQLFGERLPAGLLLSI